MSCHLGPTLGAGEGGLLAVCLCVCLPLALFSSAKLRGLFYYARFITRACLTALGMFSLVEASGLLRCLRGFLCVLAHAVFFAGAAGLCGMVFSLESSFQRTRTRAGE